LDPFLEHLRQEGRSPHTIKAFASDMRLFAEFFDDDAALGSFTTTRLSQFMEWLEHGRGVPCSRKSYARRVTTLKVFFKHLKDEKIIPHDPAAALLQRSGAAPLQPILSNNEIQKLLDYATSQRAAQKPDARPDLLLRLLLDTGIKKGECMALTLEHIVRTDPASPTLVVKHRKRTNVYKERNIPLDPDWLPVLDEYIDQYQPEETIFDCTARNLEYVLRDTAAATGVESKVSFEVLRWTSAVRDYRRGVDLDTLREKMGLSRISWRETSDKIKRLAALQVEKETR
jgi:site-specific recombinase XerD